MKVRDGVGWEGVVWAVPLSCSWLGGEGGGLVLTRVPPSPTLSWFLLGGRGGEGVSGPD